MLEIVVTWRHGLDLLSKELILCIGWIEANSLSKSSSNFVAVYENSWDFGHSKLSKSMGP